MVIRLDDASLLGKLMTGLQRGFGTIMGPWWHIAPDNPSRAMACEQAASVARLKAEAYAASLGVRLGGVIRVREPLDNVPYDGGPETRMRSLALTAGSPEAEVPVDAGELEVSATVEVKFRLEQD